MDERIFKRLAMKDSFFFPTPDKVARIAMVYKLDNGKLTRSGAEILGGDPVRYRKGAKYPAPEFGLFSTASDLLAVYQMMLNGGSRGKGSGCSPRRRSKSCPACAPALLSRPATLPAGPTG